MTDKVTAAIGRLTEIDADYVVYDDCDCPKCEVNRANSATLRAVIEMLKRGKKRVYDANIGKALFARELLDLLPEGDE